MLLKGSRLITGYVVFIEEKGKKKGWHIARLIVRLIEGYVFFKKCFDVMNLKFLQKIVIRRYFILCMVQEAILCC